MLVATIPEGFISPLCNCKLSGLAHERVVAVEDWLGVVSVNVLSRYFSPQSGCLH